MIALLLPLTSAVNGHMKLLAVSKSGDSFEGSTADLYLSIKRGNGRVFIDSFPLTKLDTQMSTRFAKEIACDYLNIDCSNLDFFYVISGKASLIGGPSAGSALTVLTASLLEKKELNHSVAITGTINAGGFIGPVGGIIQKIHAAKEANISLVLIPYGSSLKDLNTNKTYNISEIERQEKIRVVEVSHISEALPYFFPVDAKKTGGNLTISPVYRDIMKQLSEQLCRRTDKWKEKILELNNVKLPDEYSKYLNKSKEAYKNKYYYASASFCFGANVALSRYYFNRTLDRTRIVETADELSKQIIEFQNKLPKIKNLNDLEAYTAVTDRVMEALNNLRDAKEAFWNNDTQKAVDLIAYANERFYSAYSWKHFFKTPSSSDINIDSKKLESACMSKLSEAQERLDYLGVYLPPDLTKGIREDLNQGFRYHEFNKSIMCIYQASKVKARIDVVLNSIGLRNSSVRDVLKRRLTFIKQNIIREEERGHFPILSYSYYEYAKSLLPSDPASAMLYAEYSLELGSFNMYFSSPKKKILFVDFYSESIIDTGIGIIIGLGLGYIITYSLLKTRLDAKGTKSGKKR